MRATHAWSEPIRERLAEMRWGIRQGRQRVPGVFCMFDGVRLIRGSETLHRTPEARRWRTVLRMKGRRQLDELLQLASEGAL